MTPNSFCSHCGTKFEDCNNWPRRCGKEECKAEHWRPIPPVAIVIAQREDKVVAVSRTIPPFGLALPGGFKEYGETMEENAARELYEETGIQIDEDGLKHHWTTTNPEGSQVLVFYTYELSDEEWADVKQQDEAGEVEAVLLVDLDTELVFSKHTDALMALITEKV